VIRETIATLAQKKGTVKDVQGVLRYSRTATTADVYMQEIPASVQAMVNSVRNGHNAGEGRHRENQATGVTTWMSLAGFNFEVLCTSKLKPACSNWRTAPGTFLGCAGFTG
jgi:hypothetical protein